MASAGNEKQRKGSVMYVYKLDTGRLKPQASDPSTNSLKKVISRGWGMGLRSSKTVREVDRRRVNKVEEEGLSVKEIVEARKPVSIEARKSVSHLEDDHRRVTNNYKDVEDASVKEIVEARKSVSSEARKSISSHLEADIRGVMNKAEEGISVKEIVKARKSVSGEARKSVSHLEVNVGSVAAFLQVKVLVTDMPGFMQVHAFRCARRTFDSLENFSSKHMAYNMKKEFDSVYGPAWHCIVGSSFGSFVTHSTGCFLYFSMEKMYILVFKTKVHRALD